MFATERRLRPRRFARTIGPMARWPFTFLAATCIALGATSLGFAQAEQYTLDSLDRWKKVADIDPNQVNKIVVEAGGYAKMETEIPAGQLKDTYNFLLQAEAKPN